MASGKEGGPRKQVVRGKIEKTSSKKKEGRERGTFNSSSRKKKEEKQKIPDRYAVMTGRKILKKGGGEIAVIFFEKGEGGLSRRKARSTRGKEKEKKEGRFCPFDKKKEGGDKRRPPKKRRATWLKRKRPRMDIRRLFALEKKPWTTPSSSEKGEKRKKELFLSKGRGRTTLHCRARKTRAF